MSNLTPIKGSTTQKKGSEGKKCPYCKEVPADEHPDFSCPKIAEIEMSDYTTIVRLMEPQKWDEYVQWRDQEWE